MKKIIALAVGVLIAIGAVTYVFNINRMAEVNRKANIDREWSLLMKNIDNFSEEKQYKTKELILQIIKNWDSESK